MIRIGPLDPHAGFVASDNLRLTENGLRLIRFDLAGRQLPPQGIGANRPDLLAAGFEARGFCTRRTRGTGTRGTGQEELGQEDTAQDDEANLAREEYLSEILRGYGPEARRRLRQLNITGDPRSVLDEEWVQYLRDGLVETTHSGRGGVRSELREMIGKLLDEFQDGP